MEGIAARGFQDVLTTETLIAFYPGIVLHQVVIKLPEWVFLERRTQDGPRVLCIPLSGCIPLFQSWTGLALRSVTKIIAGLCVSNSLLLIRPGAPTLLS